MSLTLELLNALVHPPRDERQGDNAGNVHFRPKDVHVQSQLLSDGLDVLQAFLVVGASAANPDLDLVLVEQWCNFAQSADDTLESCSNLRKVSNCDTGS
jgi:hypothetical protein